jgi:hypothetical protein
MKINKDRFLWPEEEKLVHDVSRIRLGWEQTGGHFREDYFEPVKIPVPAHTPWQEKYSDTTGITWRSSGNHMREDQDRSLWTIQFVVSDELVCHSQI